MIRLSFKHTVILISVLFITTLSFIIFSKDTNKTISDNEKENVLEEYKEYQKKVLSDSSTLDTILNFKENTNIISTNEFDKEQIYFKDIEILYEYYSFDEVNKIKNKVQNFIHNYIDKNILDCSVLTNSMVINESNISFNISLKDNNTITVKILENKFLLDISIQYN